MFLDCRGYYDLACQLVTFISGLLILYRAGSNYSEIKKRKEGAQLTSDQKLSRNRKIIMNLLNMGLVLFYLTQTLLSMIIFSLVTEDLQNVRSQKLNFIYEFMEIFRSNLMNCLIIIVGLLYWRAVKFYYLGTMTMDHPPFYSDHMVLMYYFGLGMSLLTVILSLVYFCTLDIDNSINFYELDILNICNIGIALISILLFLISRIKYCWEMTSRLKISRNTILKEDVYNIVIFTSISIKIAEFVLEIVGIDYTQQLRQFNKDCIDALPYHALILFISNLMIDLIPSFILTKIFTAFAREKYKS
jgi:hypothetical protein